MVGTKGYSIQKKAQTNSKKHQTEWLTEKIKSLKIRVIQSKQH
jgi:hypothetical protein